jgi:hypothetical protein
VWLAFVARRRGAVAGAIRLAPWPHAAAVPGAWMLLLVASTRSARATSLTPVWAALAASGLFALGFAIGRLAPGLALARAGRRAGLAVARSWRPSRAPSCAHRGRPRPARRSSISRRRRSSPSAPASTGCGTRPSTMRPAASTSIRAHAARTRPRLREESRLCWDARSPQRRGVRPIPERTAASTAA